MEITKPDNTTQTLGPITSDPVGGGWTNYTPETVGTYTFVAKFPGITYKGENPPPGGFNANYASYINDTLEASNSDPVTIVVQEEALAQYQEAPLPTDYWTRPIYATNRNWYQIAGNWLGGDQPFQNFQPYSQAPSTAHIVWTKPMEFGGIANGGSEESYFTGSAYESMWTSGIIIQGYLYYNEPKAPRYGWHCVDLRTGEELYYSNGTEPIQVGSQTSAHIGGTEIPYQYAQLSFGQILTYDSPNEHGQRAYLWSKYSDTAGSQYSYTRRNESVYSFSAPAGSTVWQMYNAFNGEWICNIANVPSGTTVTGPNGELLIYTYNSRGYLTLWNSTHALEFPNNNLQVPYEAYASAEAFYWMWREPIGETVDGNNGYSWNITVPANLGSISKIINGDKILGNNGFGSFRYGTGAYSFWALSLKDGSMGTLLWQKDYNQPISGENTTLSLGPIDPDAQIFTIWVKETNQWYGYSLENGNQVWGPTDANPGYDMYGVLSSVAYSKLYAGGWEGVLRAFDINSGEMLWNSTTNAGGLEGPYPYWPIRGKMAIADHKVYVTTDEHSHTQPILRGWSMYCFDADTGAPLWNITGLYGYGSISIADGYLIGLDDMNNELTCFGKGQTQTTISATPEVSMNGDTVVVKGMVTDQSPGAKDTAAISDNDMTPWMEYLYHQAKMPSNVRGVEVSIDVIDPNNNYVNIGTVTSDSSGMYKLAFVPEVPGTYTIMATFAETNSYFGSNSQTAIAVGEAAATPSPIVQQSAPQFEMYFAVSTIAIIIAIAIGFAVAIIILRKRP